jgi:hypothetical protein
MPASPAESLRLINAKVRFVLNGWQLKSAAASALTPTVFTDLLAEIHNAAELLRGTPAHAAPDPQLQEEIAAYYRNVQELEKNLPAMQGRLLVEKSRLETARTHLAAAAAWAEVRKKTL